MRYSRRTGLGFTLLELLVSIAIVSAFVALAARPLRDAGRIYLRARNDAARLTDILVVTELISRDVRAASRFESLGVDSLRLHRSPNEEVSWRFSTGAAYRRTGGGEEIRFAFPTEDLVLALDSNAMKARHLLMQYRVGETGPEERGFSLRIEATE